MAWREKQLTEHFHRPRYSPSLSKIFILVHDIRPCLNEALALKLLQRAFFSDTWTIVMVILSFLVGADTDLHDWDLRAGESDWFEVGSVHFYPRVANFNWISKKFAFIRFSQSSWLFPPIVSLSWWNISLHYNGTQGVSLCKRTTPPHPTPFRISPLAALSSLSTNKAPSCHPHYKRRQFNEYLEFV